MCELTKKCRACLEEKSIKEFNKDSRKEDGLFIKCKVCLNNKTPVVKDPIIRDGEKKCSKCKEKKCVSEFSINNRQKSGLSSQCKKCVNSKYIPSPIEVTIFIDKGTRICTYCKLEKSFENFYKDSTLKGGVSQRCKGCQKILREESLQVPKKCESTHKNCTKCKMYRPVEDFVKDNSKADGLNCSCKQCVKKYRDENKEKLKNIQRNYSKNNRESINRAQRNWARKNKQEDPLHYIKRSVPNLIKISFKKACRGIYVKKSASLDILGCSMEFFISYIEAQFTEGMSWNNYGRCENGECGLWQLDHIYPISLATSEKEIYDLNHYTNFRPLWALENILKGNIIMEGYQFRLL